MQTSIAGSDQQAERDPVVVVGASISLFDWRISRTLSTADAEGRDEGQKVLVTASGVVDSGDGWTFETWYEWEPVQWCVPGPRSGVFAAYDRWGLAEDDETSQPKQISLTVEFAEATDESLKFLRETLSSDGWRPQQVDHAAGFGFIASVRWKGSVEDTFPDLREAGSFATKPRDAEGERRDGVECAEEGLGKAEDGTVELPFVLRIKPKSQLVLNADAMPSLMIYLRREPFAELVRQMENGGQPLGSWTSSIAIWSQHDSVLVANGSLQFDSGADTAGKTKELKAQSLFAHLFRVARDEQWHVPPSWGGDPVSQAVRAAFLGLSRQAVAEEWEWVRLRDSARKALSLIMSSRGALAIEGVDEERLESLAREAVARDEATPAECWPIHELGFPPLDPGTFYLWRGDKSLFGVHELARRYLQLPSMWSDGVTIALARALLLEDAARQLREMLGLMELLDRQVSYHLMEVNFWLVKHRHYRGTLGPRIAEIEEESRKARTSAWKRLLRRTAMIQIGWVVVGLIVALAVEATVGVALVGTLAGAAYGSWRNASRNRELAEWPLLRRLKKVNEAVERCSFGAVDWEALSRVTSDAADLGATWSPEALLILRRAREVHGISSTDA